MHERYTNESKINQRGGQAGMPTMIFEPQPPTTNLLQGPKEASRLAKGEAPGSSYDYEDKINFAVFPSLQVCDM